MITSKAIEIDNETYGRLKILSEVRNRSPHWLTMEAIRQFLDREEKADRVKKDTMERLTRYEMTDKTISNDVVTTWLKTWGTDQEKQCPIV